MAGRRTKYTPETVDKIISGVRAGLTNRDASLIAGITDDTMANWEKRYPDFSARLTRARAERAGNWIARIHAIALETKDWKAYAELLDRCAPEYRKTQKHELSGADGGPILLHQVVQELATDFDLDPDELAHEVEAYLAANR